MITTNLTVERAAAFVGSKNVSMRAIQMDEPNTGISTYDTIVYYMPQK